MPHTRLPRTLTLLLLTAAVVMHAQDYYRVADEHRGYDTRNDYLLLRASEGDLAGPWRGVSSGSVPYTFLEVQRNLVYDSVYQALDAVGDTVGVSFTGLPLIHLEVPEELNEWGKKPATFTYADDEQTLTSAIGIRHRGSFSLRYPKKNLDLEFQESADSEETRDVSFGGLREDDDWVLDALFNEPMRVNSYVAHKVWLQMHELYYADREPEAKAGADVQFVEVFYNDEYFGIYMLSEQVDRKQLQLQKSEDGWLRGELYKGVGWTAVTTLSGQGRLSDDFQADYGGWEIKYPNEEDLRQWDGFHALVGFVANTPDAEFRRTVNQHFKLSNLIDYIIYVNSLALVDNFGKNTYIGRYDANQPYFYAPWDLDTSFGNAYDGSRLERYDEIYLNNLMDRVIALAPDNFNQRLCERYTSLRESTLSTEGLLDQLTEAREYLRTNGAYRREQLAWPGAVNFSAGYIDSTAHFMYDRMAVLDDYACALPTATVAADDSPSLSVFPNPATGALFLEGAASTGEDYRLTNAAGAVVRLGRVTFPTTRIDLNTLPPGLYILRVGYRTAKVVVE